MIERDRISDDVEVTRHLPKRLAESDAPTVCLAREEEPGLAAPDAPPTTADDAAPEARYVILGEAGRGGMATVHVARDTELLRKVALKAMLRDAPKSLEGRERFIREVQITAQLDHPHIVPVYSLELAPGGSPAYAMKLIDGRTFGAYLDEARAAYKSGGRPDEAHGLHARLKLFVKICDAMAYAHDKGVIHRDLKPSNVMLGRHHELYVMDWGICRRLRAPADEDGDPAAPSPVAPMGAPDVSSDAAATREGSVIGTPRYMSPEQAQGKTSQLGPASDQCALGLMLFETVTLRTPFDGDSAIAVLINAAQAKLRPIVHAHERARIPGELAAIIRKATALDPKNRYAGVRELAIDVRHFLRGGETQARPDNLWQRAVRALGRHRHLALAAILTLVAITLVGQLYATVRREREMELARARELRLDALEAALDRRGEAIELRLLEVRQELEGLTTAAEQALGHGEPLDLPFHLAADFDDPARAPRDLAIEPGFERPVSRGNAAWTIPTGLRTDDARITIRKLLALNPIRARAFERADAGLGGALAAAPGGPRAVAQFRLGLENGIASIYPGQSGVDDAYDPRVRPWYTLAAGKPDAQWGEPFVPIGANTLRLPVSEAMYDEEQRLVGVASFLISVDFVAANLLKPSGLPAVDEVLLLDREGRVVVRSGSAVIGALSHEKFADTVVLDAISRGERGVVETLRHGRRTIASFDHIAAVDWTLVALADEERLLGSSPGKRATRN